MKKILFLILTSFKLSYAEAVYTSEAPLPDGWAAPKVYYRVIEKTYPASREAVVKMGWQNLSFLRLFNHIKKENIPMTAPVIMHQKNTDANHGNSMSFLYKNQKVGKPCTTESGVEVKDLPQVKVLSYAWLGDDAKANLTKAKMELDKFLAGEKIQALEYRILCYNGPNTPKEKSTWEMQAIIKKWETK